MITLIISITTIYLILILSFSYGIKKNKEFKEQKKPAIHSFSIIIPFRNEATNLQELLNSLLQLNYAKNKFECIFVDDDSTDTSSEIIHKYLSKTELSYSVISNLRTSASPKKDAINTAIQFANFDWIITTDADCTLPNSWLQLFDEFSEMNTSVMIVGPVMYSTNNSSFLENFQLLDFLSLQAATLGGFGIKKPFLCNGANLAYKKTVFLELNGFQGNDNIASGDDIFLFEKFYKKHPNYVHFLKSNKAIVRTNALKSWKELIQQRMRWAAKSSSYTLGMGKFVGIIVLLMNLAFIICMLGIFNDLENSINYLYCMLLKVGVDFILIKQIAVFYTGNSQKIKAYLLGSLLYPFFSTYIIFKTLTSSYTWKERIFKR